MTEATVNLSIGQALDLGVQYAMAGNYDGAMGLFRGVLIHEPGNFEAIERLGSSLFELGRYHEALYWFWRGLKIMRRHPLALTNYGLCVSQLGHPDEGLADLKRAAYQADKFNSSPAVKALIYNNLGNTLERLTRHDEALIALDKGIGFNPFDSFPHYNRGIVLLRLNRHHEALAALNRSLELSSQQNPESGSRLNDPDAVYNRGMAKLLLGDLKGGFADYEARLLTTENKIPNLGLPPDKKWDGGALGEATILITCEQGLGDDIQFMRFIPILLEKHPQARVLFITHKEIRPLLGVMPRVTVQQSGELLPAFDHWAALMSLPLYLGTDEDTIPAPWKPIIEPARIVNWSAKVRAPLKLNVGICWAGNFQHKNNLHRSIPLSTFATLFETPGVNFVSLQQVQPFEREEFALIQKGNPNVRGLSFDDLRDTAAAMHALDVMVSVDTALAHLSASLGIPTWILVPKYSTDWRWMLDRTDSPWYESARLFRQEKIGDWASTLEKLRTEIESAAVRRGSATTVSLRGRDRESRLASG